MHFQASTSNWKDALLKMPDYSTLKGFDAGLLMDGKKSWIAAGRDPKKLTTVLRYAGAETSPRNATWEEAKAHWRRQFWKYIDGTYLRELAPYVDVVSEANEYWTDSTWTDPDKGLGVKRSMLAAQAIWNDEFRGRTVRNPVDGGEGHISEDCRIALGAVTVSFGFPKDLLTEIILGDNIADMHCYMACSGGSRAVGEWPFCSGLFDVQEEKYGLKPRWLFGESGPFFNTDEGWRAESCLNGNETALVSSMKSWWSDLSETNAYKEGRLTGAGCWFTSGHVGWKWYQLETSQLTKLADTLRPMWKPGVDMSNPTVDSIRAHAKAILVECDKLDPPVQKHTMADKTNQQVINLFNGVLGGYDELTRAIPSWPTTMAGSPAMRAALYTGPAIEDMNLTDTEKQRLIANL